MIRSPSTSEMSDDAGDNGPASNLRAPANQTLSVSSRRQDGRGSFTDTRNEARDTADRRRGEPSTSPERLAFGATASEFRAPPPERDITKIDGNVFQADTTLTAKKFCLRDALHKGKRIL